MDITDEIEQLRLQLNEIGEKKGLQDPEVFKLSQRLDELIVQYYRSQNPKSD